MGISSSTPSSGNTAIRNTQSDVNSSSIQRDYQPSNSSESPPPGCPMHQKINQEQSNISQCPMNEQSTKDHAKLQFNYPSECPMHAANRDKKENEEPLNPLNMMPPPNQQPSPGQPFSLSTEREVSTIAKSGTDSNWEYPSQQMFWNAMLRKGWRWEKDDLKPTDMESIIKMHNMNNERAWEEVLKWESFHAHECGEPKLKKFGGKSTEFSPRARIRSWLGYDLPFDRHDWIVDRCGKEVRYIIDYYDVGDEVAYRQGDFVHIDVRPAFDSFEAVLDRSRVAMLRWASYLSTLSSKTSVTEKSSNNDAESSPA